jgi:integrase
LYQTTLASSGWVELCEKPFCAIRQQRRAPLAAGHGQRALTIAPLSLLKLCLDYAIVRGKLEIGRNPARVVKMPRRRQVAIKGTQRVVHLTTQEMAALFRLPMPARDRAVYALAIYAGLRRSELWGPRWEHVVLNDDKPHVRVRYSYSVLCKSADAVRDVPLLRPAKEALRAYRRA